MKLDTQRLVEHSARLDLDGVDFADFERTPLSEDVLRCLRYMHDVEFHTACYLRDLLVTRAHRDPEVTAFLSCWAYEEYWHGEALSQVLSAHGEVSGSTRVMELRHRLPWSDGLRPLLFSIGSALTPDVVAVHMTWGAVNEWTTQAGYKQLAARSGNPVLSELLGRIMRQEGRHVSFYAGQAGRRLASSRRSRRVVRAALRRLWQPVGAGVMPAQEVCFLACFLFDGADGDAALRRIDAQIERLPGLQHLGLVESAISSLQARSVQTSAS